MSDYWDVLRSIEIARKLKDEGRICVRNNPFNDFSDKEFLRRFRFSKEAVKSTLLPLVAEKVRFDSCRNNPAPPEIRLLVALGYFASNCFHTVTTDLSGTSPASVSRYISRVSRAFADLQSKFICMPTGSGSFLHCLLQQSSVNVTQLLNSVTNWQG